jgi:hypothetical protein
VKIYRYATNDITVASKFNFAAASRCVAERVRCETDTAKSEPHSLLNHSLLIVLLALWSEAAAKPGDQRKRMNAETNRNKVRIKKLSAFLPSRHALVIDVRV